jgi:hypothetical protein
MDILLFSSFLKESLNDSCVIGFINIRDLSTLPAAAVSQVFYDHHVGIVNDEVKKYSVGRT